MSDAFGYEPRPNIFPLVSLQVSEAKVADTLEPQVVLTVRHLDFEGADHRIGFAMTPDAADKFADVLSEQLRDLAARAREKHWE